MTTLTELLERCERAINLALNEHGVLVTEGTLDAAARAAIAAMPALPLPKEVEELRDAKPDEPTWCSPGDVQIDQWLLRFDDRDRGDIFFSGADAEEQARRMWEHLCGPSGMWNGYLFRLAIRKLLERDNG